MEHDPKGVGAPQRGSGTVLGGWTLRAQPACLPAHPPAPTLRSRRRVVPRRVPHRHRGRGRGGPRPPLRPVRFGVGRGPGAAHLFLRGEVRGGGGGGGRQGAPRLPRHDCRTRWARSVYTSYLLAAMHEHRGGVRLNTYRQMGEALLGEKGGLGAPGKASQHASTRPTHPGTAAGPRRGRIIVSSVQYSLMVGLCITYSVTAGQSLKGVVSDDCDGSTCQQVRAVARDRSAASPPPPRRSAPHAPRRVLQGIAGWIVSFGVLQLLLSQSPDFHSLWCACCVVRARAVRVPPPRNHPRRALAPAAQVGVGAGRCDERWLLHHRGGNEHCDRAERGGGGRGRGAAAAAVQRRQDLWRAQRAGRGGVHVWRPGSAARDPGEAQHGGGWGGWGREGVELPARAPKLTRALCPSPPPLLPHPQATLRRPPSTVGTMMRGVALSYVIVVVAYYSGEGGVCARGELVCMAS